MPSLLVPQHILCHLFRLLLSVHVHVCFAGKYRLNCKPLCLICVIPDYHLISLQGIELEILADGSVMATRRSKNFAYVKVRSLYQHLISLVLEVNQRLGLFLTFQFLCNYFQPQPRKLNRNPAEMFNIKLDTHDQAVIHCKIRKTVYSNCGLSSMDVSY